MCNVFYSPMKRLKCFLLLWQFSLYPFLKYFSLEFFWPMNSISVQNVIYIYTHIHTYIFNFLLFIVNEAFCGCSILIKDNTLWSVLIAYSSIIFKLELKKNHLQIIHCLLKTPLFRHAGSVSISSTYSPSHMQEVNVSNHDDSMK